MTTQQIHLVRHGESVHNVSKDNAHHDPPLTDLGVWQAGQLVTTFPRQDNVAVILTSPLRRAIATAVIGFGHILDKASPRPETCPGIEAGAKIIVYPDLQPRMDRLCDIGSRQEVLEKEFPGLNFSLLSDGWQKKEGLYAHEDAIVEERAKRVRSHLVDMLKELEGKTRTDIVLVTHGVVRDILDGSERSNWARAGWKSYTIRRDAESGYKLDYIET
jgi:broad specificity phosphatase PhoE